MAPLRSMSCRVAGLLSCALVLFPAGGSAAEPADACPTSRVAPLGTRPLAGPETPGTTYLHADTIRSPNEDVIELEGEAQMRRDGQQINADYIRYRLDENYVDARGDVRLDQPSGTQMETEEAHIDLDTQVGTADTGTYRLTGPPQGRGDMAAVEFRGEDRTRLLGVSYTTCPVGRDDWFLRASRIDLDTAEDEAVARHARLQFFGVPLFYLPYFRFPISDERKTGFLVPQVGYGSDLGTIIAAPYYLNLAPNYDATLTPRLMTERGVQLQGEFRYLGRTYNGKLEAEYLPNDDVTGKDRTAGDFVHDHVLSPRWGAQVHLRRVSDTDYINDFGERLGLTSETSLAHLPQDATLNYGGPIWSFVARASTFQTVDRTIAPANRPHARLPQLLLSGSSAIGGGQYSFRGEYINFERDAGIIGQRINLDPSARWPLTRTYGFMTPELGLRHIAYSLENAPAERPSVTVPFATLDTGLFFEREVEIGASRFDQTLEPRLYYLYTPFRRQDDLPNFDTGDPGFSFGNFFRNSRFVGGDRIGDANQLSAALTTRFIDQESGAERARASIGRLYYFGDRRINLSGGVVEERKSDIVGEAVAYLGRNWVATANAQWTTQRDQAIQTNFYVKYQPAGDRVVNLGYRFSRNSQEQIDLSAEWPLTRRWILRGRTLRSLRDVDRINNRESIHSYVGIEYRSCCWAVRLYGARTLVSTPAGSATPTEQRSQFLFELEFSGLGQSGTRFESPLHAGPFAAVPLPSERK